MPVLLVLLKILAALLLLVVLALLAALFVPMRLNFEYRPDRVSLSASYGPLRRTLFSRRIRPRKQAPPTAREKQEPPVTEPPVSPSPSQPPQKPPARPAPPAEPVPESKVPSPEKPLPPQEEPESLPVPEEEEETGPGRLEHIITLAQEQPMALLRCLAGHFHWMRHHAVCKLQIRHLYVFWTVTCEDAARTAVAYGAEMAALNTALAVLQQSIQVQSDRLWLEPDFTGTRREERRVAFSLSACAILMFGLAYRLWKDPLLQPQPENTHA